MARDMNDTGEAFRARITVRGANGLRDVFQGPYANGGAAKSRIKDVDFASETANMTQQNILQQAGASVLAQANQQPQIALKLLQG